MARKTMLGISLLAVLGLLAQAQDYTKSQASRTEDEAFAASKQFVSQRLKAPATARFGPITDSTIKGSGDGPYTVSGYVDSRNPLGTYLRLNYTCELKTSSDGHWDLIDLKLAQQ